MIEDRDGWREREGGEVILRKRFKLKEWDTINAEPLKTLQSFSSLDQILTERKGDPEKILENLGFTIRKRLEKCRVPDRFLETPSQAEGIQVEKFLEENPEVKDYLNEKNAIQNPFEMMIMAQGQCQSRSSQFFNDRILLLSSFQRLIVGLISHEVPLHFLMSCTIFLNDDLFSTTLVNDFVKTIYDDEMKRRYGIQQRDQKSDSDENEEEKRWSFCDEDDDLKTLNTETGNDCDVIQKKRRNVETIRQDEKKKEMINDGHQKKMNDNSEILDERSFSFEEVNKEDVVETRYFLIDDYNRRTSGSHEFVKLFFAGRCLGEEDDEEEEDDRGNQVEPQIDWPDVENKNKDSYYSAFSADFVDSEGYCYVDDYMDWKERQRRTVAAAAAEEEEEEESEMKSGNRWEYHRNRDDEMTEEKVDFYIGVVDDDEDNSFSHLLNDDDEYFYDDVLWPNESLV